MSTTVRTVARHVVRSRLVAFAPIVFGVLFALNAGAHIGSPNVFFDGLAGPYPVRVVIRPPGVIPGLAEISVRVHEGGVERVTVLPMRWNSGRAGAPRPDDAGRVRGETNLYHAELWFMTDGAQSVEVEVSGSAGKGTVLVPVNAVATRVLAMPRALGWMLALLGILLLLLAVSIFGTAVRESVLVAGDRPTTKRLWLSRGTMAAVMISLVVLLAGGKRWWDAEASDYRNNRLYQPLVAKAEVRRENNQPSLRIERAVDPSRRTGPIVPDHGKLMHLFLVRDQDMSAFAHLHPVKRNWNTFETPLPDLPAGDYTVYADVTYETGFADTLTARIRIDSEATSFNTNTNALDADDAWHVSSAASSPARARAQLLDGTGHVENRETELRFLVQDGLGNPAKLEPYMGMAAHLIVRRDDGSVFTHLHPGGSFSMAAQQLFEMRASGRAPLRVASVTGDPLCQLPDVSAMAQNIKPDPASAISFPYAFPKPGKYRLWLQTRVDGAVLTSVFDVDVAPQGSPRRRSNRS